MTPDARRRVYRTKVSTIPWYRSAAIRCGSVAGSVSDLTHRLPEPHSAISRYSLAVLSIALALAAALVADRFNFRGVEFPLFLFAIAGTVWFAGPGPAVVTLVLSSLVFNYYFTEPFYSLYVTGVRCPVLRRLLAVLVPAGLVQRRAPARRAGPSAIPRRACERGHGTDPAGDCHSRAQRRARETIDRARSHQQGTGSLCLLRLA